MNRVRPAVAATLFLMTAVSSFAGASGVDLFLPVAGRVEGAGGSQFYSTLTVSNTSEEVALFTIEFLGSGSANPGPPSYRDSLSPGESKSYDNFVEVLFRRVGLGAVRLRSNHEIAASARIYHLRPGAPLADSAGTIFSATPAEVAIRRGGRASILGATNDVDFRSNLFLVETTGQPAAVRLEVRAGNGAVLRSRDLTLAGLEQRFLSLSELIGGGTMSGGRVDVEVTGGDGRVIIAGAQTANGSQDGSGYDMTYRVASAPPPPPGVTTLNGLSGEVRLQAGQNISLTPAGNSLIISATAGPGGALTLPFSAATGSYSAGIAIENQAGPALLGTTHGSPETGYAVWGQHPSAGSIGYLGSTYWGVGGVTSRRDGAAVYGLNSASGNIGKLATLRSGVEGHARGAAGVGVLGVTDGNPGAHAGYFDGRVAVTGLLSKGGGSFKIDHPLDPANKYLYHSFVESPDMKNIYDGVVTLDSRGEARVNLPDWFESLNEEFRYQLTTVGGYAPVYVSEEMSGNHFAIAGGFRGLKVSWQVTGIRKDAFARANRIDVEEPKPEKERGTFLHPEAFEAASRAIMHGDSPKDE